MAGLLEMLLGGLGNQQPMSEQERIARLRLGGEDTPAGGGAYDARGQQIMAQRQPQGILGSMGQQQSPAGAYDPSGNAIDMSRPKINNADGSFSTERTIGIEMDGKYYNIPTIVNGKQLTEDQAVAAFQSGQNQPVGVFNNQAEADAAAQSRSNRIGQVRGGGQAPQPQMPQQQGGGLPGVLASLFGGGRRQGSNSTVQWLVNKGVEPSAAQAMASDPTMLRQAVMHYSTQQGGNDYQVRRGEAAQLGLQEGTPEWTNFIAGRDVIKSNNEKLPASVQEYEYAKNSGAFNGSYTDWQTKGVRDQDKGFSNEKDLNAQYTSDPNIKEYAVVRNNYERIREGAQMGSGAGDIAIIFGYMKMLDPTSVVRENEQATAENAGGVPDQVRNLYNKLMNGDKLPANVRQMYVDSAGKLYGQVAKNVDDVNTRYKTRAGSWKVDFNNIGVNPEVYDPLVLPQDAPNAAGTSGAGEGGWQDMGGGVKIRRKQ